MAPFPRWPALACACVLSVNLIGAGCSTGHKQADARTAPTTTTFEPYLICDLIDLAVDEMRKDGVTFVDLLDSPSGGKDDGARAVIALAIMARGRKQAGAFRPALAFLAERSVAESDAGVGKRPRLTPAIRANAKKLDAFVAGGGCR